MEEDRDCLHFLEEQKGFFDGKVVTVKGFNYYNNHVAWVVIDGIVHASLPSNGYNVDGILLPIKETEEYMKLMYKRLFGIDIPEDVHQWPYKKEEE